MALGKMGVAQMGIVLPDCLERVCQVGSTLRHKASGPARDAAVGTGQSGPGDGWLVGEDHDA
jgi:hypothetical protein